MRADSRVVLERVCANPDCARSFGVSQRQVKRGYGLHCSRRCQASMAARRQHALHPQDGERNHNFKGWASRNKRAYVNRFRAMNPEKARAHDAVKSAIVAGRLVRPTACERCGITTNRPLDSHHDDYSRPLDVRFVCRACHRILDAERRERTA